MKTLSANVSTGVAGNSRPAYLMTIEPSSTDSWNAIHWSTEDITDLLVESAEDGISTGTTQFDSAGSTFITKGVQPGDSLEIVGDATYIVASVTSETQLDATANINAGNPLDFSIHRDYEGGRIERGGLGTITKDVDILDGGNVATVSDFSFTVLNQDDFLNSTDFPSFLEGRTVDVRLLFTDGSGKTWPNALILHQFTIESIEYSLDVVRFECIDASVIRHTLQLPQNVLTDSDAAAGQGGILPDVSKNKGKPLIYGDHVYNFMEDTAAGETSTNTTYDRLSNLTPCRFLGLDQDGDERWLVADHQVDTFNTGQGLWAFDPALGRMVKVLSFTVEQNNANGCIVSLDVNATFIDYWLPDGSIDNEATEAGTNGDATITDPTDACNLDNSDFGQIFVNDGDANGTPAASFDIDFPEYQNSGTIGTVNVWALCYKVTTGGTPDITINAEVVDRITSKQWELMGTDALSEAGVESAIPCSIVGDTGSNFDHDLFIYMVYKEVRYTANNRLNIFAGVIGREFGAWVDADSRNQGYNSGDAIAKAFSIESLLRDEMSLTSSEIDYVAYDAIGNTTNGDRKAFDLDFSIIDQKNSIEYISEICRSIGSMSFTDFENKESIKAIDAIPAIKQFTTADYELVGGGDSKTSSFRVRRTSLRNVYNDIEVYYSKNWGSNEYQKIMFCNKDAKSSAVSSGYDTKCAASYANYGFVRKLILKTDYIITDATAADLVEWLVDWFYLQKRLANFTSWISNVAVELGDMTTPTHSRLYPAGNAIVTMIAHDLDTDEISFELIDHTMDNLLSNGDFESLDAGAPVYDDWTETDAGGTVSNETTIVYRGSNTCKLTFGPTDNDWVKITQTVVTVAETLYTLSFTTRGDGGDGQIRYTVYDVSNAANIRAEAASGVTGATGTNWIKVIYPFTTPVGCISVRIELVINTFTIHDTICYVDEVKLY